MGHMQLLGAVVTRSVPDEHGLDMGRQGLGELLQKAVKHRRVEIGSDDRFGLSRVGTGRADHVDVLVLRLPHGARS